ncbi:two-component sensor histidine kinase, partial [Clavibacter nebraskensis]
MARHPRTVDAVIAIAFTLLSVSAAPVVDSRSPAVPGVVALAALSVLTGVALMFRRSRPVAVLAVTGAAAAAAA